MDDMLRYASLAGAGLPEHERHRAKSATVRQLRRVQVDGDGASHHAAPIACHSRDDLAVRHESASPVDDRRRSDQALLRAAVSANGAPARTRVSVGPAVAGRTRKLILLAY